MQFQGVSKDWDMILIKNISKGGLLFNYDDELKIGTTLNLKINIALNKNPIHCIGKVVRMETSGNPITYEAGVYFTEINNADAEMIEKTVEKFLSEEKNRKD